MIILGVAFLSDASACVLRDGTLLSAVSEERLNRIKLWHGVPRKAIDMALRLAGVGLDDVDLIATHGKAPPAPDVAQFEEKEAAIERSGLADEVKAVQISSIRDRHAHERRVLGDRTPAYLKQIEAFGKPMAVCPHHTAHAASAYHGSGWDDCYVLTADGWGEDGSSTLWRARAGDMTRLASSHTFDSLGYFYGSVTKALGFIPHRHEGKVLGLAAHCRNPKSYAVLRDMVAYDAKGLRFRGLMENGIYKPRYDNPELKACVSAFNREDVAAAAQRRLEEVVCELVADLEGEEIRLAVAGGVFANVRLNQRLRELDNIAEVYVFPNMGDGGLSVGAAWLAHWQATGRRPEPLATALHGNPLTEEEIGATLASSGLIYQNVDDIERRIAELLADAQVVARAAGAMEFGPRALGNRSILYQATEPGVNEWLNARLSRSEFMPFAPATLEELADGYYRDLDGGRQSARYMTMTFDCTDKMRQESPAAVHVDGTARPQLVSPQTYPAFHRILSEYHRRTGLPNVINTSFNMHEEPIVCTAEDAVRAFRASGLPWLALGDFLVKGCEDVFVA